MTGAIDATDGRVIGTPIKIATQSHLPKEQIVENIAQSIRQVMTDNGLQKQDVVGVGVGSTGPLDLDLGLVLDCPQLPTMQHFALREALQQAVDLPVAQQRCQLPGIGRGRVRCGAQQTHCSWFHAWHGHWLCAGGRRQNMEWCHWHSRRNMVFAPRKRHHRRRHFGAGRGQHLQTNSPYRRLARSLPTSTARRTSCARCLGNLWPTSSRALSLVYQPHRPRCGFAWWLHCHRPSLLYACHDAQFAGAHLSVARPTHIHRYGIVGRQRRFCGRGMPYAPLV